MNRIETIVDLIARSLGITTDPDVARLTSYLELYADTVNSPSTLIAMPRQEHIRLAHALSEDQIEGIKRAFFDEPLPPLTEESVLSSEGSSTAAAPPESDQAEKPAYRWPFSGAGGGEKRQIYERLCAYRERSGLGSFAALVNASDGSLSEADVRGMFDATPTPIAKWKALDAAMDSLES